MSEPTNTAADALTGGSEPTNPTEPINPTEPTNPTNPQPTDPKPQVPDGYVALPTDKSTPEELAAFYTKLGRPESADKYGIELTSDEGAAASKAFADAAFNAGLTKAQAQAVAKASNDFVAQKMEAYRAEQDKQMKDLQTAWGADFNKNTEIARQAARQFGLDNKETLARLESALGSKALMELMHKIGSAIADPAFKGVGAGRNPVSAKAYTREEAAAKMKELQADKAFGAKFMANDPEAKKLFEEVSNAMAGGN